MNTITTIPITFDKSHLTTIGRRLYAESLDLVRELVANAYDADATIVKINLNKNCLVVDDNGRGMDKEGLKQYFTIGSDYKKENPLSPKYKRVRIGEFGIGKFAVLALCDRFELFTRHNSYSATVVFDRDDFDKGERWEVPLVEHREKWASSGTRVTLDNLKRQVLLVELERKLRNQLPLLEKSFSVYLNGVRLSPTFIPGRRFRIRAETKFGSISGEIVIASLNIAKEDTGIAVKVKGIAIRRMFFNLDKRGVVSPNRITGTINCDFLPITSSRDNFIVDSEEFREFKQVVSKKIKEITRTLMKAKETKELKQADRALSDALVKVRNALKRNRDIFFLHDLPLFSTEADKQKRIKEAVSEGVFTQKLGKRKEALAKSTKLSGQMSRKLEKTTRGRVKTILRDQKRLVKRLKIGGVNIVCSLSSFGQEEAESFTEGGVIFINRDHPLFIKTSENEEVASFNFIRVITKELILLARPVSAEQAFNWQYKLLTDSLIDKR